MKSSSAGNVIILFSMLVLFSFGGCYTVLMDPLMLTSSEDGNSVPTSIQGDYTYTSDTAYNYSQAELDERYYDIQNAGLNTAPGTSFDPYGWLVPSTSLPWWYEAVAAVPPTAVAAPSSSAAESRQHRRTTGSTRGNDQLSPDIHASTTVTTTTTTIITAPPPPAATAAPESGTTTDRSRTTGNNSAAPAPATRNTGSNRGDGRD
jgi:hypothetical protein